MHYIVKTALLLSLMLNTIICIHENEDFLIGYFYFYCHAFSQLVDYKNILFQFQYLCPTKSVQKQTT